MELLSILLSLGLLMYLAYRGMSVLILAPAMALLAVVLNGDIQSLLPVYTQVFMKAMGGYLIQYFPLFCLAQSSDGSWRLQATRLRSPMPSQRNLVHAEPFLPWWLPAPF